MKKRFIHKNGKIAEAQFQPLDTLYYTIDNMDIPAWMIEGSTDWVGTRLNPDKWTITAFYVEWFNKSSTIMKTFIKLAPDGRYIMGWDIYHPYHGYTADEYLDPEFFTVSKPDKIPIEQVKRSDGAEFRVGNQVSILEANPSIPTPKIVSFYLDGDKLGTIPGMLYGLFAKSGIGVKLDNGDYRDIFDIEVLDEGQGLLPPLEPRPEETKTFVKDPPEKISRHNWIKDNLGWLSK